MFIAETDRLRIRHFTRDDAPYILKQVNERAFIENIGDKGVRNLNDATDYLYQGPIKSYQENGFGLNAVELKSSVHKVGSEVIDSKVIGMCGILKRPELELPDLGYSLLTEFAGFGYGTEAAIAVLEHARDHHKLTKLLAITSPDNHSSLNLLKKVDFNFVAMVNLYSNQPDTSLLEYVF